MAVYSRKVKDGIRWYYKFDYSGITYFSGCIYKTKGEAKRAENEERYNLRMKQVETVNLSEIIQERINFLGVRKSKKYVSESNRYLTIFFEHIGDIAINHIKKKDVQDTLTIYQQTLKSRGHDNYAVNAMLRAIKALFNFAINELEIKIENPAAKIKNFPIDIHFKYIPTDEEIDNLLAKCDEGQKELVLFVRHTGARIGEALKLSTEDIFEDKIVLYTRKSYNSNLTPRKVPKPDFMYGKEYPLEVFGRWKSTPDFLDEKLKKMRVKVWTWHNLRHKYASELSKNGVPIFEIMNLLGHSNLSTTQNYLQLLAD